MIVQFRILHHIYCLIVMMDLHYSHFLFSKHTHHVVIQQYCQSLLRNSPSLWIISIQNNNIGWDCIHFTHFINKDKNNKFISNVSNIRNISFSAVKLYWNDTISSVIYKDIKVNSFWCKVLLFITKRGAEMVPIDIWKAFNNVEENTNNQLEDWPELEKRCVMFVNNFLTILY